MKKTIVLLLTISLMSACHHGKAIKKTFTSSECFDGGAPLSLDGYTITGVAYGDSYLVVVPLSTVHPNSEFRFALAPKKRSNQNRDYKTAKVSITSDDDDGDTPADWLDVEGTYADAVDGMLVACVPDFALGEDETKTYKYKVTISDGTTVYGYLDPRADIIPWR
jgi:hypothetical protein